MDGFMRALVSVWTDSGFAALTWQNMVMILVGLILLYLAIAKEYEPLLLLPIAAWLIYVLVRSRKKHGGCCGCCADCAAHCGKCKK